MKLYFVLLLFVCSQSCILSKKYSEGAVFLKKMDSFCKEQKSFGKGLYYIHRKNILPQLDFINFKADTIYRITFLNIELGAIKTQIWTRKGNKSFIINKSNFVISPPFLSLAECQKIFEWEDSKNKILNCNKIHHDKYNKVLGGDIAILATRFILNNNSILSDCFQAHPQAFLDTLTP